MSSKYKTTTKSSTFQRCTRAQLASIAKQWQKQYVTLGKVPAWKTTAGKTPTQQRTAIVQGLKRVVTVLRTKTLQQANVQLKTLKTQVANTLCVSISSPKVTSTAIKRLNAKISQIKKTTSIPTLVNYCATLKVSSYKNPVSFRSSTRSTTGYARTGTGRTTGTASSTKAVTLKYKKQTSTLKREIQKLKQRNTFMRSQVAKFRKEVSQLQRHYGTLSNTSPRGTVVNLATVDRDVSNIVRFSNALSNAIQKQQQRKVG